MTHQLPLGNNILKLDALSRQKEIYTRGVSGKKPLIPTDFNTLEKCAKKKLTKEAYAYVAGGAGLESTVKNNRIGFNKYQIVPKMLHSAPTRSLSTEFLGNQYSSPFFLCPIGVLELVHHQADLAIAQACRKMQVPMMVSNQASFPMENIAKELEGGDWYFQLYISKSDDLALNLVKRAEQSGAKALVITLDTTLLGWRNRDLNLAYLPFLKGKGIAQYTSDPVFSDIVRNWPEEKSDAKVTIKSIWHLLRLAAKIPGNYLENLKGRALNTVKAFTQLYTRPDLDWAMIEKIRLATNLPIILKGIQNPHDAQKAIQAEVNAIYVSNHGGRQVDGAIASIDTLANIKTVVKNQVPILFDSGIRCGADAMKAIALGANMVGIGRPYVYALGLAGSRGVTELIKNFSAELELNMSLSGSSTIDAISNLTLIRPDHL
ncbi:MAG: alpha-hydroxy-acid oxidizing protein [Saprospiraceae bacterium]